MIFFLAVLAVWFGYKKARDTGRNGVLWGAICGTAFLGVQFVVSTGVGVIMAIGIKLLGWSEDYQLVMTITGLVAGIVTLVILFKYLDRVPEGKSNAAPPPPPNFRGE